MDVPTYEAARISPTSLGHGRGLDRMSKESKPLKSPTPVARRPVLSYSMPLPSVTYKAGHGLGSTVCIDDCTVPCGVRNL